MKGTGVYKLFLTKDAEYSFSYYRETEKWVILKFFYKANWIRKLLLYIITLACFVSTLFADEPIWKLLSILGLLLIKYLCERNIKVCSIFYS